MPSGAKKRKAAKRKGTQPNTNNSNPSPAASTHGAASSTTSQDMEKGNIAVPVERELKNGSELAGKFDHNETERKSYDGGSSGSSGSSSCSDDESHGEKIDTVPTVTIVEASEAVLEMNTSSQFVSKDNGEKKVSAEVTTPSVEHVEVASDLKTSAEETDERFSLSYNAPIATHDNGVDLVKDSGVTEPLLVPPPCPVKTTSWKGCCGLFELFTSSYR
ncbi:uncharacterized protein LOC121808202 isoform X2 [Salvia splendens]|uniref:uncharacterized protein LOC121808202 isoform X2 n=1 Tax=Salvia splendens TaxID=180675 RepID=UPI001C251AA9|nr:uncharacterized protein LOC121808202 isoform X2 [Salvia splendens]